MNDGIIKADGTSRLMRAELPATYEEFRTKAAAGTMPMDILFNAAGWTQLPTFLNKGALLKDLTAAMFGLGTDAVPDDVLAFLGKYNQHWWRRRTPSYYEAVVGEYGDKPLSWRSTKGATTKLQYSDSIAFDAAGVISLVDPVTINISYTNYTAANVIKGKYFQYKLLTGEGTTTPESGSDYSGVHLAANEDATQDVDATTSEDVTFYIVYMSAAPVTSLFTDAGQWEYLQSSERNAYPDSGISDGYEYEYLGIPFENAVGAPKIAVGSYVGTGFSTQSKPVTLKFGFAPKFVFIAPDNYQIWSDSNVHSNKFAMQIWISGISRYQFYKYNENSYRYFSSDNNGISFYEVTGEGSWGEYSLNRADHAYHYFAVG